MITTCLVVALIEDFSWIDFKNDKNLDSKAIHNQNAEPNC